MEEVLLIPQTPLPFDSTVYDIALMPPPVVCDSVAETEPSTVETVPAWEDGLVGEERVINAGDNSGVLALVAGMVLVMMLSYRGCRHLFGTLFQELLGIRSRENAFDEHTSNEARLLMLMALQWSICTALLLYSYIAMKWMLQPQHAFADVLKITALTASYYLFQYCAYYIVGFTFTSPHGCRCFVQGFTASQSLLGFTLVIPALTSIFYPEGASAMIPIGAALYAIARIIFIIKGFRIFYDKITSLLYFILYLCTLEIIPILFIYKAALVLVGK